MVAPGMRRYRQRSEAQAELVGPDDGSPVDPRALFPSARRFRLELGCGHGEFISRMAAAHPDEGFIGNEFDHLRVTKCAHKCLKEGARHVRLFCGEAERFLPRLPTGLFLRIYILFPDPWPKAAHRRRRLLSLATLRQLTRVAAPGCRLVFASDTHNYACQVLAQATLLPGMWRARLPPSGYAIDAPVRFPTVFELHKRAEGCTIMRVELERTEQEPPP